MSILTEKDPSFIQDTRIEGNLSVVPHPNDQKYFGNGSVEISGTLKVDTIKSATPGGGSMVVSSPLSYNIFQSKPPLPLAGYTQLYADGTTSEGRLVMVDSTGKTIDLNPLTSIGDLMTFNGLHNTTSRLPIGLPQQTLTCSPDLDFSSRLAWKSDFANVYSVTEPSDGYLRYAESYNSSVLRLTNVPQPVLTDFIARQDTDAFSIASGGAGGILILQPGYYEVVVAVKVSVVSELAKNANLSTGSIIPIETYLDSNGVIVPASTQSHNVVYLPNSHIDSSQSISTRMILYFSTNTRLRVLVSESGGSNTGVLQVKAYDTSMSVMKLAWKNYTGEYLMVQGIQGSRPPMVSTVTVIPTTTVIYKSNASDVINTTSVTIANAGNRNIIAKFSFQKSNVNTDLSAILECRLLLNGTAVTNGVARTAALGSIGNISVTINTNVMINTNDTISIDGRILSGNLTSGGILALSEQCSITVAMPYSINWKQIAYRNDSLLTMNATGYTPVIFNVMDVTDTNYKVHDDTFVTITGGTYQYVYSMDFRNIDTVPYSVLARLSIDSGTGWKLVPGSTTNGVLPPTALQTYFCGATLYLPPQSKIRCEIFSPDGGQVQVMDHTAHIAINKYETTRSATTGLPDFGNYYNYIHDDDVVITTSTTFSVRLVAGTINLPAGNYRFGTSFEWDMSNAGIGFVTQVILDNNTTIDSYSIVPVVTGIYSKVTSFQQLYLDAGEHTISFNTKVNDSSRGLYTRNVRLEFWKL